jgi:hypothetical protein
MGSSKGKVVKPMSAKERAFWAWWEDVEPYQHLYSLRMAFDAGYNAANGEE